MAFLVLVVTLVRDEWTEYTRSPIFHCEIKGFFQGFSKGAVTHKLMMAV